MKQNKTSVLFVCMGNICRSPTAEAVFKKMVGEAGLEGAIESDSAGTHDYHIGEPPDGRATRAARKRGYDMTSFRGRQVGRGDFERFDYILAMDGDNLARLERLRPADYAGTLALFCDMDEAYEGRYVPDPYFGGEDGFEQVLDMVEDVSRSLIARIQAEDGQA